MRGFGARRNQMRIGTFCIALPLPMIVTKPTIPRHGLLHGLEAYAIVEV